MSDQSSKSIVLRGKALDKITNLLRDGIVRSVAISGYSYVPAVELLSAFHNSPDKRRYWSDLKRALHNPKSKLHDSELYESIVQLKISAADGKKRLTDFVPLHVAYTLPLLINTPQSIALKKEIGWAFETMSIISIKHRAFSVSQGMEWAADTIHHEMIESGLEMTFTGNDPELKWWQR